MKKSVWLFLVAVLGIVGCGDASEPVVQDEGAMATAALETSDSFETLCPTKGGTYSRGETPVDARMRRSASPVVFIGNPVPPQRARSADGKPWGMKVPIAVRTGTEPVDVAVMDADGARVGLAYDDWSAHKSIDAAYQRIRFMPCEGDDPKPTWYGWPGAILSDRENVCLKLAVREGDSEISLQQFSFGNACPEGVD